eukprot:3940846-Rhodomonas_salina.2
MCAEAMPCSVRLEAVWLAREKCFPGRSVVVSRAVLWGSSQINDSCSESLKICTRPVRVDNISFAGECNF